MPSDNIDARRYRALRDRAIPTGAHVAIYLPKRGYAWVKGKTLDTYADELLSTDPEDEDGEFCECDLDLIQDESSSNRCACCGRIIE